MSVMTESRNVTWQPFSPEMFGSRRPKQCSEPGCTHAPTQVRIVTNGRTRRFVYCDGHLYH